MQIIQSTLLNPFVNLSHCFTTKDTRNLAFHVKDNPQTVNVNHEKLAKLLEYEKNSLVHMKQIHSSDVRIVQDHDNFTNPQECDALITNKKNIPLMVMVADCSPILFYDKAQSVIAVAHAGRQGAFKNIVQVTLDAMKDEFNSHRADIYVSIGASIGECCYEVGDEIYTEAYQLGLDYALKKKGSSYYLNISSILEKQLLDSAILKEHMEISNECTCCNSEKYFSYRADEKSGRFAGVIMLKEDSTLS